MPSYNSVSVAYGRPRIFKLFENFINKILMLSKSCKIPPVAKSTGQDFAHVCGYSSKKNNKSKQPRQAFSPQIA